MRAAHAVVTTVALAVAAGCESAPPPPDRHAQLLDLASQEAELIAKPFDRLTRQLNFAYRQQADGHPAEAKRSLDRATKTLEAAKPDDLNDQVRIAGWVSVSELSLAAGDKATAQRTCDTAVGLLKSLPTVSDRPEYAVGVADEVRVLDGKPAAAKLLVEAGEWTRSIHDTEIRRAAVRSIAAATFDCDDLAGGQTVLRTDPDPAWRSDTLVAMADSPSRPLDWISNVGNAAIPGSTSAGTATLQLQKATSSRFAPVGVTQDQVTDNTTFRDANGNVLSPSVSRGPYGKPVDFRSVFLRH